MVWRRKKSTTTSTTTSTTSATTAPTTSSTTATTSTTTVPVTTTSATGTRGEYMGISAGATASTRVLDDCVALGIKWVRVSHEYGWNGTVTALANTVTEAHARGLKVLQAMQKAGHIYSTNDINSLAAFAQQCIATGIDALELGNEFNNPAFFTPDELPPVTVAAVTAGLGQALRSTYPLLPIITAGMSPRPAGQTPHLFWPSFWDQQAIGHMRASYTAQALHPYVYPEDPCGLIGHPEWNPWWALPIIRDSMAQRGVGTQQVWFTEVGCPGDPTGATIIRNIVCDEARQAYVTGQYLKQWQTLGRAGEPIFIATAFDGDSVSTPGPEQYLGLCRTDGTRKAAWTVVRDHAALPL